MKIQYYHSAERVLIAESETFLSMVSNSTSQPFHVALSGGPAIYQLFKLWINKYKEVIPWNKLRFYWVDEVCVPPSSPESYYGNAEKILFIPLGIPNTNIHRIFGEEIPEIEAKRYSEIIKWELPGCSSNPRFDCCITELGSNGEIASIFSHEKKLLTDTNLYTVTHNPITNHSYITMTERTILRSRNILISAIGVEKHKIVKDFITNQQNSPAGKILSHAPSAILFTDYSTDK